jgi:hypothetical protein
MKSDVNIREESIYGKEAKQYHENKKNKKPVNITDYQLCVETELILRHLDEKEENGKRWFFSTIEDVLNSIKEVHIN